MLNSSRLLKKNFRFQYLICYSFDKLILYKNTYLEEIMNHIPANDLIHHHHKFIDSIHQNFLSYKKKSLKNGQQVVKISDLYFIKKKNAIEVIHKKERFKHRELSILKAKKEIDASIQYSMKHLQSFKPSVVEFVKELNEAYLQRQKIVEQVTRATLGRSVLRSQSSCLRSRSRFKLNHPLLLSKNSKKETVVIAQSFDQVIMIPNEQIRLKIQKMMEDHPFSKEQLDEIVLFLKTYVDKQKILDLAEPNTKKSFFHLLEFALKHSSTYMSIKAN